MNILKQHAAIRYILVLLAGITLGALFYPTKRIEEKIEAKYKLELNIQKEGYEKTLSNLSDQLTEVKVASDHELNEASLKMASLVNIVKDLETKLHEEYREVRYPDGRIEIARITDSSSKELTKVTQELNSQWQSKLDSTSSLYEQKIQTITEESSRLLVQKETEYKSEINELTKTKVTTTNPKNAYIGPMVVFVPAQIKAADPTAAINVGVTAGHSIWGPLIGGVSVTIPVTHLISVPVISGSVVLSF